MFFIIMTIFSFIMYYLTNSIQSLLKEVREVKNKCIHTNNSNHEDFMINTPEPYTVIKQEAINILQKLKKFAE